MNYDTSSNQYIGKLLLFIFWPFGAWLYSLKSANSKSSYLIYVLFGMLLCWSMYYDNERAYLDFIHYANDFYTQAHVPFSSMLEHIKEILIGKSYEKDVYRYFIVWFSQTLSDNFHTMFLIASVPFLFFMLKCVKLITDDNTAFRNTFICLVLLFLFVYHRDIIRVQNFRFATATWVFVYGFLMTYYKSKKYFLIALLSPFIHASFWIVCVIFLLYVFLLSRYNSVLLLFYLTSIPFAFFASDALSSFNFSFSFLPDNFLQWIEGYTDEETNKSWGIQNNYSGSGFYFIGVFFFLLQRICLLMVPIYISKIIKNYNDFITLNDIKLFYGYSFLFAIINFMQSFPVLSSRFWTVIAILTAFMLIKFIYKYNINEKFIYVYIFSFTLDIMYTYIPKLYLSLLPIDFYFSDLITLITRHLGVTHYM